jgi:hypothetical protein
MANFLDKLTQRKTSPVAVAEQTQGLNNLSVSRMMKPTDAALLPSNADQVATMGIPTLTRKNFGKTPISDRHVKEMESHLNIVRSTVANGKKVLDAAAEMKEQEAQLATAHGKYIQRAGEAEYKVQRANVGVASHASKLAVAYNRSALQLQGMVGSAKHQIALDTSQYEATASW